MDDRDQPRPIGREATKAQRNGKRKKEEIMDGITLLGENIEKIVEVQKDRKALSAGSPNADLVARLFSTLSVEERMIGVVVGKGCLKLSGGGSGGSGAAKTVMETRGRGSFLWRPRVTWSPVDGEGKGEAEGREDAYSTKAASGGGKKSEACTYWWWWCY
ncbi:hypothetical protein E2562_022453 [Oryza meyeriana var. granulata]|uniref:Uncharacterized protein n=1 Tax=Oryza meyeriana var. granulata TaxID=110450 RepID=A0A6G1BN50_9ORYZ|nr:hypothetical protein E2562_022453 [Oryza meyeriana var. granulata]